MFTKTRLLRVVLPLLLAASVLTMGSPSASATSVEACWSWNMDDKATGTFLTDGDHNGSTASAGTYTLSDFKVDSSIYPSVEAGSISDGTYSFGVQPPYSFIWNGTAPTTFQRNGYTNGFGIYNGTTGTGAFLAFGIEFSSIYDTYFGTFRYQASTTILLNPTTLSDCLPPGISPMFTSITAQQEGFSLQISNYDAAFTFTPTTSAGSVSISAAGLITVYGLRANQSATVSVTTTRSGYASGSGSVTHSSKVAPLMTIINQSNFPTINIVNNKLICDTGNFVIPTGVVSSLYVNNTYISSIASGDLIPYWLINGATNNSIIYNQTLNLNNINFNIDKYINQTIRVETVAYKDNAIAIINSNNIIYKLLLLIIG